MIDLIGPRGLGDAIFVRSVAVRWIELGEKVTVFTTWPEVFDGIGAIVRPSASRTGDENIHHCVGCLHCRLPDVQPVSIFRRICHQSGLFEPFDFRLDWKVKRPDLIGKIKRRSAGRKIMIYQPPKIANGFEQTLFNPRQEDFFRYLEGRDDCYRIKVGHASGAHEYKGAPCELDLFGKTTVSDVFDIATICDLFFSQVSYLVTLGEALDKQVVCMFTKRALSANSVKVRQLTPDVFFHKRHLVEVVNVE
jgi:hypothetical protein